jgi:hypothetical protein
LIFFGGGVGRPCRVLPYRVSLRCFPAFHTGLSKGNAYGVSRLCEVPQRWDMHHRGCSKAQPVDVDTVGARRALPLQCAVVAAMIRVMACRVSTAQVFVLQGKYRRDGCIFYRHITIWYK